MDSMSMSMSSYQQRFVLRPVVVLLLFGNVAWHCLHLVVTQQQNALECYACDSAVNVECATKPGQQIDVEECLLANDVCVTSIEAGHTRRGCLSRLYPSGYCGAQCERCSTNLCNRAVYPADRLRCYQCSGSDCGNVTGRSDWILPCPVYHESDRCYTNVIGLSNVLRGCEHTNLPADCPHVCLKCNYDGCNNEVGLYSTSCLQCSHNSMSPQPECLRQQQLSAGVGVGTCASAVTKRCSNKLMHGHVARCFSYINEQTGVVERGCSSTMGFYSSGNVSHCYGENCNTACFSIACNQCSTRDDGEACRLGRTLRAATCPTVGTLDCYTCETAAGYLRRGCMDAEFVADGEHETCDLCRSGDGCNRYSVRSCYHCSSLEDGVGCAAQIDAAARVPQRNCTAADELCVSTLVSHYGGTPAYTIRGCASQVPECTAHDALCVRCNGSLCNTQPIAGWFNREQSNAFDLMLARN